MRIALYYPWVYLTSGAERVAARLTGDSRHDWTIFTHRFEPENTYPDFSTRDVVELHPRLTVKRTIGATALNCVRAMLHKLPLDDYDAFVVLCEGLGDLLVFRNSSKPTLCVCLTPLRIAFDEVYRERWMASQGTLKRAALRAGAGCFRAVDRMAWRHYQRVFFISGEARRRAMQAGLVDETRSEVIYPGLGVHATAASTRSDRFFLLPGRIMWTKNIELGIAAFQEFAAKPENSDYKLVIAGIVDVKSRPYFEKLRDMARGDERVRFVVHPSDSELRELYETCTGVLFTAFNEDYGIVPLEAMAHAKPVVAVNRGGPRETVQDGIQGFLEEPEPRAFAARMALLAADPVLARRMGAAGFEHVKRYNWSAFVGRIDDELDRVISDRRRYEPADRPERTAVLNRPTGVGS